MRLKLTCALQRPKQGPLQPETEAQLSTRRVRSVHKGLLRGAWSIVHAAMPLDDTRAEQVVRVEGPDQATVVVYH